MNRQSGTAAVVTIISVIAAIVIFGVIGISLLASILVFSSTGTSSQTFVEIAQDLEAASSFTAAETVSKKLIQDATEESVTFSNIRTELTGTNDGTGIVIVDGDAVDGDVATSWRVITNDDETLVWGHRYGDSIKINTDDEALKKNLAELLKPKQ